MRYFTSDLHFFDPDIISYCDRPYRSVAEMNEDLVARFNRKTAEASEVYILGDLLGETQPSDIFEACRGILEQMGIARRPFHLVLGNHDPLSKEQYLRMGFRTVERLSFLKIASHSVMLTHDPCMVQLKGTVALCGHVHTLFCENWQPLRGNFTVNVSVEVRDYAPMSEEEFLEKLVRSPLFQPDGPLKKARDDVRQSPC